MLIRRLLFLIYFLTTIAYGDQSITQIFSGISNPSIKMAYIGKKRTPYLFAGHFGQVDILKRINEGNWTLVQTLQGAHKSFGQSLGIADYYGTIVVGAPFEENTPNSSTGKIYIYEFTNETWEQIANSTNLKSCIKHLNQLQFVGYSLDIMGWSQNKYRIAVGAPSDLLNNGYTGEAQVLTIEKKNDAGNNHWQCTDSWTTDSQTLSGLDVSLVNWDDVASMGEYLYTFGKRRWLFSNAPYVKSLDANSQLLVFSDKVMGMMAALPTKNGFDGMYIYPNKNYLEAGKEITLAEASGLSHYVAAVHLMDGLGHADLVVYRIEDKEAFQVFDDYTFNYNKKEWLPGKSTDIVVFYENENNTTHRIAVAAFDDLTNSVNIIEFSSAENLQYPWLLGFALLVTSLL